MSASPIDKNPGASTLTLGELLYSDPAIAIVPEKDWLALVRAMAAGDELALRALFERAYPVVFTYVMRMTLDRRVTEDLILKVFEDLWCEAPVFDATNGPVLGWIMRQARVSALAHARRAEPFLNSSSTVATSLNDAVRGDGNGQHIPEKLQLNAALDTLTVQEREAIEAALLNGMSYAEFAARRGEPIGTVKKRMHSALTKLRQALQALPVQGGES